MKKKINHKIIFFKTIVYRFFIVFIQAIFTSLYLKYITVNNFTSALNISIFWNFFNMILYYIYEYCFSLKYDASVQTKGAVVWLTGLPCSGKTTIAKEINRILKDKGKNIEHLDGDIVRKSLCKDLGFSEEDRAKNLERITFVSKLLKRNKTIVLCSFVSPFEKSRQNIRTEVGDNFIEVYVQCNSDVCAERDVKGMWKKANEGIIKGFTGFDAPYEVPKNPEIVVNTDKESLEESVGKILNYLSLNKFI